MPSKAREQVLSDRIWERVRTRLPGRPARPKGGRPPADDRACFAGIVYVLRNGIRWNAMPACFPSGVTCWRRHRDWTAAGVWEKVWKVVLDELDRAGKLDCRELFLDATFAEARKGGPASGPRNAASG
jgi:transposase